MTKILVAIADAILVVAKVQYITIQFLERAMNRAGFYRVKLNAKLHKIKKIFRRW